ncbi:biotin carboxyl carrier protein of acetyl-CoA carboxylase, chloroplastic [Trifolium repens]|nr:biotin carboxyl carrier protein of acetyl-CoA carboxylase, chloroplastic [Trifolium repens]
MASSLSSTSPTVTASASASAASSTKSPRFSHSSISFPLLSPNSNNTLRHFFTKGCPPSHMVLCPRIKAQLNEVALDGSSNDVPPARAKSDVEQLTTPSIEPSSSVLANEETISQFFTQVASLVKLVDSRDIVELKLKQLNCEVLIRKKEAMPQPEYAPQPQPAVMYTPPSQTAPPVAPSHTQAPRTPSPSTSPLALKAPKSSRPPLKSPMAGTFYRSPGPSEPPFVKVGDKVKKGQVLCIIEAMKLMNEIEADQSGTIVEIVAEDAKPVSVDTPLFVIEP